MNVAIQTQSMALRALMADEQKREVECQAFLEHANFLLAPPLSRVVQVVREQIAMAGRSDYFLLCEVNEVDVRRRLVLWEAKAPQLCPFDTSSSQNRLIPSQALVEAENQLLYYFDEYRSNGQFLDRYQLRHPDDVKLGGIIIGRDDNWVHRTRGNTQPDDVLRQMASSALRIRDEHFYRGRIKVLTWDRIAAVLDVNPVQQNA
jgi:hypothetical protein